MKIILVVVLEIIGKGRLIETEGGREKGRKIWVERVRFVFLGSLVLNNFLNINVCIFIKCVILWDYGILRILWIF